MDEQCKVKKKKIGILFIYLNIRTKVILHNDNVVQIIIFKQKFHYLNYY